MTARPAQRAVERLAASERPCAAAAFAGWLGVDGDVAATWPQVFGPRADARHYAIRDGDRILSHAAAREVRMVTPDGPLRVDLIGGVGTAPELRGQGCATALLEAIAADARRAGVDALLLWSEQWEFYERLGFAPVGWQLELGLRPGDGDRAAADRVRPATPADLLPIWELHAAKPIGVRRAVADLEVLLTAAPMQIVVLERDREVRAYGCLGKGLDFAGWWHEVGGADRDVAALLRGVAARPTTLLVAPYRPDLPAALGDRVTGRREGFAGLALSLSGGELPPLFVDGLDSV